MANEVRGLKRHIDKLRKLQVSDDDIDGVLGSTAELVKSEIQSIITNEIRPHNRRGQIVKDLVDTGFLRQNWQVSKIGRLRWQVSTNTEYAPILEYGYDGPVTVEEHKRRTKKGAYATVKSHKRKVKRRGYFFVRRAKVQAPELFRKQMLALIDRIKK